MTYAIRLPIPASDKEGGMNQLKNRIGAAWKQFLRDPDSDVPGIRPFILESWRRSRKFGVDPCSVKKTVLTPEALREKIDQNRLIFDTAVPFLENLYEFVKGSGFCAILSDRNGIILHLIGDQDALDAAKENLLVEGADRSEATLGTNAIGTALYVREPLQVWADEHYYRPHSVWSCSSAPIFDPDGELVAVLCLSGSWESVHFHTLGMVVSASKAITKQLELKNLFAEANDTRKKLDKVIELHNYGLLFTDEDGRITQINALATNLLNIKDATKDTILGNHISEYAPLNNLNIKQLLKDDGKEHEFNLESFMGTLHCSAALLPLRDGHSHEIAITIRKAEHIHRMINRIVGSSARFTWDDIVGESPSIREVKRLARVAAPYPSNVLLHGESGTGKELFAQAIHNASDRAGTPFIAINCGALPRSLIESELFGYEGGSFTNSKREGQAGKFELANGGTIFLDEIGDMPFDVQANLLRVLQTREIVRIGGRKSIQINVRIISATNKNLEDSIVNNTFREDLYYRLNVFAINIPPLRDREGDIRLLSDHMLLKYATSFNKPVRGFRDDTYDALTRYTWPGNLRELENTIERAVLVCQGEMIAPTDLPTGFLVRQSQRIMPTAVVTASKSEENLIRAAISLHKGNIRRISQELGLSRSTLYRKLKKYDIDIDTPRA